MSNTKLPSPGVTEIGGSGHTPLNDILPASRGVRAPKIRGISEKALASGMVREIQASLPDTPGVKPSRRSIMEVKLDTGGSTSGENREFGVAKYISKDGESYRIRYGVAGRDGSLKLLPNSIDRLQWAVLREIVLSTPGTESAINVFESMKLNMSDDDGKQMFPITVEMLRNARAGGHGVVSQATRDNPLHESDEDMGFSLGEDEG